MSVTKDEIAAGLRALGVEAGMTLLVHSSLSSFGYVEGGAEAVIDALLEAVGPTGTIAVPTLTFGSFDEEDPAFDVRATPSGTGRITEVFRRRPEAVRSLHPVSSVAAIGPRAVYLTSDHADTPCSLDSPYGRVYGLGGASLFLGAPLATNSIFHVAEEIADPAYLIYRAFHNVRVTDAQGRESRVSFRRYDCGQRGIIRHIGRMESVFAARGILKERRIGCARCVLLPAKENVETSVDILRANPSFILE